MGNRSSHMGRSPRPSVAESVIVIAYLAAHRSERFVMSAAVNDFATPKIIKPTPAPSISPDFTRQRVPMVCWPFGGPAGPPHGPLSKEGLPATSRFRKVFL